MGPGSSRMHHGRRARASDFKASRLSAERTSGRIHAETYGFEMQD